MKKTRTEGLEHRMAKAKGATFYPDGIFNLDRPINVPKNIKNIVGGRDPRKPTKG